MSHRCERPCCGADIKQARAAFDACDTDADGYLNKTELTCFVDNHPELWAMLEITTGRSESECQTLVTSLLMDKLDLNKDKLISWGEFQGLWYGVLSDPKGQLDFFHAALFGVFDPNKDGVLDREEFSDFLDIFYKEGSVFLGDYRLPEKNVLRDRVYSELDTNDDGLLTFSEMRPLLTGSWVCTVDAPVKSISIYSICSGVGYKIQEEFTF